MKATRQDFLLSTQGLTTERSYFGPLYKHQVKDKFDIKQAAMDFFPQESARYDVLLLNNCITSNTTIAHYNTVAIDRTDGDNYPRAK